MARPVAFLFFLVDRGLLPREEAEAIMATAAKSSQLLGQMLLRRKLLTLAQMVKLLDQQACEPGRRLGELAIESGYVTRAQLEEVLSDQAHTHGQHPLDQLLMSNRLSQAAVLEALIAYVKLFDEPAGQVAV